MTAEDLSPADREIAQIALVRIWLAKKKRARWEITHGTKVSVKRYDMAGRVRSDGGRQRTRTSNRNAATP